MDKKEAKKMKRKLIKANHHCSTALRELQFAEEKGIRYLVSNEDGIVDEIDDALEKLQSAKEAIGRGE